jgi:hypothetical protein
MVIVDYRVVHTFVFDTATVEVEENEPLGEWLFTVRTVSAIVPRHTNSPVIASRVIRNSQKWEATKAAK